MKTMEYDNKRIIYCKEEIEEKNDYDYIICTALPDDENKINRLKSDGYHFHDRIIKAKINISSTDGIRKEKNKSIPGLEFSIEDKITNEMYTLAYQGFQKDKRFHLNESYIREETNKVIDAYIQDIVSKKFNAVVVRYGKSIIGYTVLKYGEREAENVLGVTDNSIVGKIGAYALYCMTLSYMKESGYNNYVGRISSKNLASLNLHINLGASLAEIYDEYIWRRK